MREILQGVSRGIRLTAVQVRELGLRFYRGRHYILDDNIVYVIGRAVVVTVVVIGGGNAFLWLFLLSEAI